MLKKVLLFTILSITSIVFGYSDQLKKVLILNSYRSNYSWTSNIEQGIADTIDNTDFNIELSIEYLDIIDNQDKDTQFMMLYDIYRYKYKSIDFDVILTSDNNALEFIKKFRDELWNDIPVVFCGLNGYKPEMLNGFNNITGVVENVAIQETIDLIIKQNSDINNVLIWSQDNINTKNYRDLVERIFKDYDPNINIIHAEGIDLDYGLKEYQNLKANDIIFLLSVLRDKQGHIYPTAKTARLIANMSAAPVYSLYDVFLGHGIVGGYLVSGYYQGVSAAEYVVKILQGEEVSSLPVIENSPNHNMFDDSQLFKFKISKSLIPANSILVNLRESFYQRNTIAVRAMFIIMTLFFIAVSLKYIYNSKSHKLRERSLVQQRSSLFELSKDLISITTIDGYFKQINKSWTELLGWSEEELKKDKVTHFVHPDDLVRVKESLSLIIDGQPLVNLKLRYRCKDKNYIWLSLDSYVFHGAKDIFAVARDITDEKQNTEKLLHLASIDELTNIHNRRSILSFLYTELQRSLRYKLELGVLMIDVDHFKEFNDQYGHQTGDIILRHITDISKSALRSADIIGRYGGEEFIIILPESNKNASMIVAERIRKAVSLAELENNMTVTISIGCTVLANDETIDKIIERADKALYTSKECGRNRVSLFVKSL